MSSARVDIETLLEVAGPVQQILSKMPEPVVAVRTVGLDAIRAGHPSSAEAVTERSGIDASEVREALELMVSVGAVELDESGLVIGVGGLTLRTTAHRLLLAGVELHTWCALDAIGIPAAFGENALVRTSCPFCGRTHEIRIEGGHSDTDQRLVFWFPTASCSNLSAGFCPQANLFCNPEHLESWRSASGNPDGLVLDMSEVEEIGRKIWTEGYDPALRVGTNEQ